MHAVSEMREVMVKIMPRAKHLLIWYKQQIPSMPGWLPFYPIPWRSVDRSSNFTNRSHSFHPFAFLVRLSVFRDFRVMPIELRASQSVNQPTSYISKSKGHHTFASTRLLGSSSPSLLSSVRSFTVSTWLIWTWTWPDLIWSVWPTDWLADRPFPTFWFHHTKAKNTKRKIEAEK